MTIDLDIDEAVARGGGSGPTAAQRAYATLAAARGLSVLWDYSYVPALTLSGSKIVRLGPRFYAAGFNWGLAQVSTPKSPVYGTAAPSGILGGAYTTANATSLLTQDPATGAPFMGSMSSLMACAVTPLGQTSTRMWSVGQVSLNTFAIGEYYTATNQFNYYRSGGVNAAATPVNDGAAHVRTSTYDATLLKYNYWLDGAQVLTNVNNSAVAPTLDVVSHGCQKRTTETNFLSGTIWLHLLANVAWTSAEVAAYSAAAKVICGTP